ncbi:hypothetical protein BKA70DRAFT_1227639 [Coprinopsis sp. MPI-PUGE-AT-0042]|nr:hypothetical protein BKA70DRAFT_1227639 [Coprinopsis sp. MPI-PUGE-AT-0042]
MSTPDPERVKQLGFYGHVISQSNYANTTLTFIAVSWQFCASSDFSSRFGSGVDSSITYLVTISSRRLPIIFTVSVGHGFQAQFDLQKCCNFGRERERSTITKLGERKAISRDASRGAWGTYERLYSSMPDGRDYLRQSNRVIELPCGPIGVLPFSLALPWLLVPPALTISTHIVLAILTPIQIPSIDIPKSSLAVILLNVSTNIMITCLIVTRLVRTRRQMVTALPGSKKQPMYSDAMAIIVESAAPLAVFGVLCAISQVISLYFTDTLYERARWEGTRSAFALLYYSFCALSPQMIIFRVTTGRSWNRPQETVDGAPAFSRPIQFAHATIDSSEAQSLDADKGRTTNLMSV